MNPTTDYDLKNKRILELIKLKTQTANISSPKNKNYEFVFDDVENNQTKGENQNVEDYLNKESFTEPQATKPSYNFMSTISTFIYKRKKPLLDLNYLDSSNPIFNISE